MLKMGPDLVRASGFELAFYQGHIAETFQHPVVSNGGFSKFTIWKHVHHLAVFQAAADMSGNGALIGQVAPNKGVINAVDLAVEEELSQA